MNDGREKLLTLMLMFSPPFIFLTIPALIGIVVLACVAINFLFHIHISFN